MALVDAGVPMKDCVVSCTASLVKNTPLVDVNNVEQTGGSPELVVSILPNSGEVQMRYAAVSKPISKFISLSADSVHVIDPEIPHGPLESGSGHCHQGLQGCWHHLEPGHQGAPDQIGKLVASLIKIQSQLTSKSSSAINGASIDLDLRKNKLFHDYP